MKSKSPQTSSGSFDVRDILLILLRHKWKILLLGLIGLGAAAAVHMNRVPEYQSKAKLLVKYVQVSDPIEDPDKPSGKQAGASVIDAQVELLTSTDLAASVAEGVGLERLFPNRQVTPPLSAGADKILGGLLVETNRNSDVIHVSYQDTDPELAIEVLRELVKRYREMQVEIYTASEAYDMVTQQADEVKGRLLQIEGELNKLKSDAGVMSLAISGESFEAQRGRALEELMMAEAELAEQKARIVVLQGNIPAVPEGQEEDGEGGGDAVAPADPMVVQKYQELSRELAVQRKVHSDRSLKYMPNDALILRTKAQIRELEAKRLKMIDEHPGLLAEAPVGAGGDRRGDNMVSERAKLNALQARRDMLKGVADDFETRFAAVSEATSKISELERRRGIERNRYEDLVKTLESKQLLRRLDPSQTPGISDIQKASAPKEVYDDKLKKIVLGLAGSGFALGIGLALLIEMVLDRRIRAPGEVTTRLQVPLMLSIPYVRNRRAGRLSLGADGVAKLEDRGEGGSERFALAAAGRDTFVLPYAEAIRNQIIFNFEVNEIRHKPKLVALTGLSAGAGTSTIARGVAEAFAEIEGVKVLFVDLNEPKNGERAAVENGEAHTLDKALKVARRTSFKENGPSLHYARAGRERNGSRHLNPLHFHGLIPEFRASEYDYIVFDMPPVDPTSPTMVMAGMMDKVLLVLDGQNTNRESLKWGYHELSKGRAAVSCVFNKTREAGPRWLIGEP